ncbi:MAG: phosphopantetheine-binding protein [Paucimonas sp.]|jgi:acyl carrier protein|nr:phosphopantetheine-binding protein [Paucimonas sp.]
MNTQEDTETLITSIVAHKKHLARVSREQHFREDLGLSSMDALEILILVEDQFHIEIPDEDSEHLETVGDLIDDVRARLRHGWRG